MGMLLMGAPWVKGQDIHFSQVDVNPILFNPAYAGFFDGAGRLGLIYRNQWASVSKPFQTFAATGEFSLLRNKRSRNGLNVGVIFDSDRAGSLSYGITSMNGVVSFFQALGSRNATLVSVALLGGVGQTGFNGQDISMMDPSETFAMPKVMFGRVGVGMAVYHQFFDGFQLKFGVSANNLNKPSISYFESDSTFIYPHISAFVRGDYRLNNSIALQPLLAYQHQRAYNEVIYGADVKWYLEESFNQVFALSAGFTMRHKDALIVNLSAEYNAFVFALSYDANVSYLATASHTIGAFELGLVYRIIKQQRSHKSLSCPIF